jgi:HSP20 family protein
MKNKSLVRGNGERNFFPAMPSLMDDFFGSDWLDSSLSNWKTSGSTLPAVNVRETNNEFMIEVAAPGMKRDDFKVELDNNILTISSQREDSREQKDEEGNYTRREFSYESFQRSFGLPQNKVKAEEISAKYTDGVLHVSVPKTEDTKTKPVKQIEIG